jgi:type I restriction enzyme S subunit
VLSALDSKIEINNRINTELEAMAKTLYDYWFVQFDFPNEDGKPYKTSGGKMVWNAELKREIPEGWIFGTVLDIAELLGGGTPQTKEPLYWNGTIPFFTPKDTENSFFVISTKENISELGLKNCSSKLYPKGTIFITARGTVGNINIASKDMAMNQSCYAIKAKQNINPYFLHQCVNDFVKYLKAKANGSVFDAIVSNDFKQTPIVIPPLEIIKDFGLISENIYEKILNNRLQNQALVNLRDWLLPLLMNGQVSV